MIHGFPRHLLRGHVRDRPQNRPFAGRERARGREAPLGVTLPRREQLGEAEVEHLHPALSGHHDVGGLEVAVDDAALVCRAQRLRQGNRDLEDPLQGQAPLGNQLVQRLARHQLHGQEVNSLRLLDGIDGDDAGMVQRRHCLRLPPESLQAVGIGCGFIGEDLERHLPIHGGVQRLVHHPHPPPPDLLEEAVMRQRAPRFHLHRSNLASLTAHRRSA